MRIRIYSFLAIILSSLVAGCSSDNNDVADVNLVSCLQELTTVETFARTPRGKMAMISTYDKTGGNQDWGDLRQADKDGLVTIANLQGPGCVKRIWMTSVPATEWYFFFDGEKEPRIKTNKLIKKQDLGLFGLQSPFLPPLCDKVSGGAYCYMPLPYSKSLRIAVAIPELKKTARPYYHINYETYPVGTKVESFPVKVSDDQEQAIEGVRTVWDDNTALLKRLLTTEYTENTEKGGRSTEQMLTTQLSQKATAGTAEGTHSTSSGQARNTGKKENILVPLGAEVSLLDYSGAGELISFTFKLKNEKLSAYKKDRLLRELRLRIYWDGNKDASVDAPFGDFFCNGINNRDFSSMALGHLDDSFICQFPMPFNKSVRMTITNDGESECGVDFAYNLHADSVAKKTTNYFHARWTQSRSTGVPLSVLSARGSGHYVGCYLSGRGMDGGWNILEGDETFLVDGEAIPSLHGTGLEDYFNGAWYYYGVFDLPTHGLLEKAAMNTCQYRFHIGDPVKFNSSLNISFEFGDGNRSRGYMSTVAYWYQNEPVAAGTLLPAVALRYPKLDQVEMGAVMANLFELERAGLYKDAMSRCLYYAERLNNPEWSEMLALRAIRYEEEVDGFDAVVEKYKAFIAEAKNPEVKKQAQQLLWFHESQTNSLLGVHINARYKIYLDGKIVGKGNSVSSLSVWSVMLSPGEHEIAVEATPTNPDAWVSTCLQMYGTNDISSVKWEYSKERPLSWPNTSGINIKWVPVDRADAMLPQMNGWQFLPNAFINMQSGKQLMRPWPSWRNDPAKKIAYLRRRFVVK